MIGSALAGYRLLEQIGEGGFGKVYRAVHVDMGRVAAVKIAREARFGQMLVSEGRLLARLSHPNIVDILHMDAQGDPPFVVMEYVDGESLAARLQRGPLTARQAIKLALPLLEALGAAHELGILHRDIKPSNILIAADGTPKLADFGLGRVVAEESLRKSGVSVAAATSMRRSQMSQSATEGADIAGTIAYMSPEQMNGQSIDARSDLYSLGVVLYEAVTGKLPVGRFKLPGELFGGVPEQLDALLDALLAPEPADRPSSAQAARAVLANHRHTPRPPAPRLPADVATVELGDLDDDSLTGVAPARVQGRAAVRTGAPAEPPRPGRADGGSTQAAAAGALGGWGRQPSRAWVPVVIWGAIVAITAVALLIVPKLQTGTRSIPDENAVWLPADSGVIARSPLRPTVDDSASPSAEAEETPEAQPRAEADAEVSQAATTPSRVTLQSDAPRERTHEIRVLNISESGLIDAARAGDIDAVRRLLEDGVDVNERGHGEQTALYWAAANGRMEIARLLLDYGATVNTKTASGLSPVDIAWLGGHDAIAKLLIREHGGKKGSEF